VIPEKRRDLLIRAGRTLYGERWQTPLSHDLRCSDRTIRRWTSGGWDVPEVVVAELRGLLMARAAAIHTMLREMDRAAEARNGNGT